MLTIHDILKQLRRDRSGAAMLEMALLAPVLILMFVGIVDGSQLILSRMSVERASRSGAEYAVLNGYDVSGISSAISNTTGSRGNLTSAITASPTPSKWCGCPDAQAGIVTMTCGSTCGSGLVAGTYVTSSAQATHKFVLPWSGHSNTTIVSANTSVRIE